MLSQQAIGNIGILVYAVEFDRKPNASETIDRILRVIIYDPISKTSPEQWIRSIHEVLASQLDLSKIGPETPHDDDTLRSFLKEIARAIADERIALPTVDVKGQLNNSVKLDLEPLLQKLKLADCPSQALEDFDRDVIQTWYSRKPHDELELAIGYALKTNYGLAGLIDNRFSEVLVRQFLFDAAWMIKDHLKKIESIQTIRA